MKKSFIIIIKIKKMKTQEEFLLQQQRLSNDGKNQRKNSFHFNDLSWEEEGQKVSKLKIINK